MKTSSLSILPAVALLATSAMVTQNALATQGYCGPRHVHCIGPVTYGKNSATHTSCGTLILGPEFDQETGGSGDGNSWSIYKTCRVGTGIYELSNCDTSEPAYPCTVTVMGSEVKSQWQNVDKCAKCYDSDFTATSIIQKKFDKLE